MKAVLLQGYGGVDQLEYGDAPEPKPGAGEVLIRVVSTSVNPVDYKIREGALRQVMKLEFPAVLGRDVAGTVTDVGPGVDKFKPGDAVMGLVNHSYAEYLTAKSDDLCKVPEGLDLKDAGVLPLILLTGAQLIEEGVQPKPGELILVTGAAGSVGRTAVYVAKQHGAKVIAGVRAKQKSEARSLGADTAAAIDDEKEIAALPQPDAIADTVGGETIARLIAHIKKSGRLASVVGKPEAAGKADIKARQVWSHPDPQRLYQLAEDVRDGKLKIPIAKRMPLSEVRKAQEAAQGGVAGKIALYP